MILVSACLLGVDCKYNGKNNLNLEVLELLKGKEYTPVCPEQLGGLMTPRKPAEIREGKVINNEGVDVTQEFEKGARETLKIKEIFNAEFAILKEGSPSCGSGKIYNGKFEGKKIEGKGITVRLLEENGVKVCSEENFKELF
ncbi:DUF523 domain-containing protein [uncultured Clostridium sp.]|uniref:DUF523 domain-containing protein n=1 Tax=uncultured Clostridium sp. TaxID=59620 RepID=UPI0026391A97|nr:DUF523 domain-containing protein [uncultured Clostridium sp.]